MKSLKFMLVAMFVAAIGIVSFSSFKGNDKTPVKKVVKKTTPVNKTVKAAFSTLLYWDGSGWTTSPQGSNCDGDSHYCTATVTALDGGIDDPIDVASDVTDNNRYDLAAPGEDNTPINVTIGTKHYSVVITEKS